MKGQDARMAQHEGVITLALTVDWIEPQALRLGLRQLRRPVLGDLHPDVVAGRGAAIARRPIGARWAVIEKDQRACPSASISHGTGIRLPTASMFNRTSPGHLAVLRFIKSTTPNSATIQNDSVSLSLPEHRTTGAGFGGGRSDRRGRHLPAGDVPRVRGAASGQPENRKSRRERRRIGRREERPPTHPRRVLANRLPARCRVW